MADEINYPLHNAHVLERRYLVDSKWLADRPMLFRKTYLEEIRRKRGDEYADRLQAALKLMLDERIRIHNERMAQVKEAAGLVQYG
ncbi:MAG: hypothetical protein ACAH12_03520 [Methylophilaceae bacterium]